MLRFNSRVLARLALGFPLAGLPGACAPSPQIEDATPPAWSQIAPKTFTVNRLPGPESEVAARAREAVVQRLARFGFEETASGRFRVDISFTVRPTEVVLGDPRVSQAVMPPAFCRRVSYALTVAITDRATATQLLRRRAEAARCRGRENSSMDELADLIFEHTALRR